MTTAAAATLGMALGGSGIGFFLNAASTYMELSRVMTTLDRRFQSLEGSAAGAARALGFARAEGGALAETLGAQTNILEPAQLRQYLGMARTRGLDPSQTVGTFGRMQRLMGGRAPTGTSMARMMAQAGMLGMGEGMQEEYLQVLQQTAEREFQQTGRIGPRWSTMGMSPDEAADFQAKYGLEGAMTTAALPAAIFGANDPRALGMEGAGFTQRLGGAFQSGGPWKSYLMRAMGFGREGGPDYMTMRERLEAGVTGEMGAQNVLDVAKMMQAQGLGQGAIYRGLEGAFGGQMKAHELRALSKFIATPGAVGDWASGKGLPGEGELGALAKEYGWKGAGEPDWEATAKKTGAIPTGDVFKGGVEDIRMGVGKPMAETVIALQGTLTKMAGSFENLTGFNPLDILDGIARIAEATEKVAGLLESGTEAGGLARRAVLAPNALNAAVVEQLFILLNRFNQSAHMQPYQQRDLREAGSGLETP